MLSDLPEEIQRDEIYSQVPISLLANISRAHLLLANERKYKEEILATIRPKDVKTGSTFAILIGDEDDHVMTIYAAIMYRTHSRRRRDYYYEVTVLYSSSVANGIITEEWKSENEPHYTQEAEGSLEDAIDVAARQTREAYFSWTINNPDREDYELNEEEIEFPVDVIWGMTTTNDVYSARVNTSHLDRSSFDRAVANYLEDVKDRLTDKEFEMYLAYSSYDGLEIFMNIP